MFYVYELIDPRDGMPFYIGKGKGARVHRHERDAEKGADGPKCDRIREIVAAGHTVAHRIVKRFADEVEAYAFEADLIEEIGLHNLTNITSGGGTPRGMGDAVADARLAKGLAKLARRTLNFTWFPKFVRLGNNLYPMGACHVLSLAHAHAKLVSRRGDEWVAKYSGNSRAYALGST